MNFYSDNISGVAPQIMTALIDANRNIDMSYGEDVFSKHLESSFSELFETAVKVFPVTTGTAANALAMSVMVSSSGKIFCHEEAHMYLDECDAPVFYTEVSQIVPISGKSGKISTVALLEALTQFKFNRTNSEEPSSSAISLTQATETGTLYKIDEIREVSEIAHSYGLALHMDGARFANAVARLNCSPADITWRSGIDVLSFGVTKNGGMSTEAVLFFNPYLAENFLLNQKRYGHLLSKTRFSAVQLEAYLKDNLWLKNAHHANSMAEKLAMSLELFPEVKICYPIEANEVFIEIPEIVIQGLTSEGFILNQWERGEYPNSIRLVTSFNSTEKEINDFVEAVKRHLIFDNGVVA